MRAVNGGRLYLAIAHVSRGDEAVWRDGAMRQFERAWLTIVAEQALTLPQHHGERERADLVDDACGEQSMHKLGAALRDESGPSSCFNFTTSLAAWRSATEPQDTQSQEAALQIRIDVRGTLMTAVLEDNPTSRDFVSLLPLTMTLEDMPHSRRSAIRRESCQLRAPLKVSPPPPATSATTPLGAIWRSFTQTSVTPPASYGLAESKAHLNVLRVPAL